MYNDELKDTIISSLENTMTNVADTAVVLASQGYLINKSKLVKLQWANILTHAFKNIDTFSKEQQANLETLYNKLSTI